MEKFADEISRMLNAILSSFDILNDIAEKEREYIVTMDVDALWQTTREKKALALEIESMTTDLYALIAGRAGTVRTKKENMTLTDMVRALSMDEHDRDVLKQALSHIHELKQNLAMKSDRNRQYLTEHLAIIDDIMSTVSTRKNETQYINAGHKSKEKNADYYISEEV